MNEIAQGLAGSAPISGMVNFSGPRFKGYADQIDIHWRRYQERIGQPMSRWAVNELPVIIDETVFYPFSGPDFLTVSLLRPNAKRYVLVANQRAGRPIDPSALNLGEAQRLFDMYSAAWEKFGQLGFFLTTDLMRDTVLTGVRINPTGTLMAFAARLGYKIDSVTAVRVREDGKDIEELSASSASDWSSVRIKLRRGNEGVLLDYVYIDLSDIVLNKQPASLAFIREHGRSTVLLKAASHLPQSAGFVHIRQAILDSSPLIIQDETGIEYNLLNRSHKVQLYGQFTKQHHLFSSTPQATLAAAYRENRNILPLGFRIGYEKESGSSLQVAAREGTDAYLAWTDLRASQQSKAKITEISAKPSDRKVTVVDKENKPPLHPGAKNVKVVESATTLMERELLDRLNEYEQRDRTTYLSLNDTTSPYREYLRGIGSRLQDSIVQMRSALPPGKKLILSLRIGADGKMQRVDIARSTGNTRTDQQVLSRFPARLVLPLLPSGLASNRGVLEVILTVTHDDS